MGTIGGKVEHFGMYWSDIAAAHKHDRVVVSRGLDKTLNFPQIYKTQTESESENEAPKIFEEDEFYPILNAEYLRNVSRSKEKILNEKITAIQAACEQMQSQL